MNKLSSSSPAAVIPVDGSVWARLGSFAFRKRRRVLAAWVVVLVGVFGAVGTIGSSSESSFESPNSDSLAGFEILKEHFGVGGSFLSGSVVFEAPDGVDAPAVETGMSQLFEAVDAIGAPTEENPIDDVTVTSPYSPLGQQRGLIAANGTIAYASIDFDETIDDLRSSEIGGDVEKLVEIFVDGQPFDDVIPGYGDAGIDSELETIVRSVVGDAQPSEIEGVRVEIGGAGLAEFEPPESELIGLGFAVVILILAFGSVLAMGLPIGVALFGVGIGVGTITLLTNIMSIPDFATTLGAMIGLGVGIDYALFIVTRYREGTREGLSPHDATVRAIDTAGRAVLFAGLTVVISLLGMYVMQLAFINGLATGAAVTVAITMVASVTLLPALIGFAGSRVEVTRWRGLVMAGFVAVALLAVGLGFRTVAAVFIVMSLATLVMSFFLTGLREVVPPRTEKPLRETWSYRWSRFVQHHSWAMAIGVTVLLLVLSVPVLSLRLGFGDESTFAEGTTTRDAYELLADGFGAGSNGPLLVVAKVDDPSQLGLGQELVAALDAADGVASAVGPIPSDDEQAFQIFVVPETGPQEAATSDLVRSLRDTTIPAVADGSGLDVLVTGAVASSIDFSDYLAARLPVFFIAVLSLSFLLLMMVFRSVLVPLKAVIMNLLSIGGAYGLVVAVFQWGWGVELLGTGSGPIEPFLPMMLFAIVFGLSMDYEVFLLSRVREEYDKTGDAINSVADGLAATARVITAAAAIMVVVFGSFVLEDARVIKMFGLGLASAVFLDATLVRMLLVPATMELLGEKNWWLPNWLDRILPTLNVEGTPDGVDDPVATSASTEPSTPPAAPERSPEVPVDVNS